MFKTKCVILLGIALYIIYRGVAEVVTRWAHNPEIAGSIPATATILYLQKNNFIHDKIKYCKTYEIPVVGQQVAFILFYLCNIILELSNKKHDKFYKFFN